jgi:hypothetical protein
MVSPAIAGFLGFMSAFIFIVVGLAKFLKGTDQTHSLSNLQIILWTGVILGSYLSMAVLKGGFLGDINTNLLALMGISAGSSIGAKAIKTVQQPVPPKKKPQKLKTKGLLSQEKAPGELSIAKLQMFAWTLVSLIIYVAIVAVNLSTNNPVLPDIGSGLLVLMGISHASYIGNKIADSP